MSIRKPSSVIFDLKSQNRENCKSNKYFFHTKYFILFY